MSNDQPVVIISKELVDQVAVLVGRVDASPDTLRHLVKNLADAYQRSPNEAPAVAVEVRDNQVKTVLTNFACEAIVADYDVERGFEAINVPNMGSDSPAAIYKTSCEVDPEYIKVLGHLEDIFQSADEHIPEEWSAVYSVADVEGRVARLSGRVQSEVLVDLDFESPGYVVLMDEIQDISHAEFSWRDDTNTVSTCRLSVEMHHALMDEGLIERALFNITQGASPETAAQDARESFGAARP